MAQRILIAEDDYFIRLVIAEFLRESGYEVIEVGSADDAIATFKSGIEIDLLFSDVRMPGSMDGCGLAKQVRAQWPKTPIILTTGYSSAFASAREAAEDIVVPKPYRPQTVLATIQSMIQARSASQGKAGFSSPD